jgi:hypothetical protein
MNLIEKLVQLRTQLRTGYHKVVPTAFIEHGSGSRRYIRLADGNRWVLHDGPEGTLGPLLSMNVNARASSKYLVKRQNRLLMKRVGSEEASFLLAASIIRPFVPNFLPLNDILIVDGLREESMPSIVALMSTADMSLSTYFEKLAHQGGDKDRAVRSAVAQFMLSMYAFSSVFNHSISDRHSENIMVMHTDSPFITYDSKCLPFKTTDASGHVTIGARIPAMPGVDGRRYAMIVHIDFNQMKGPLCDPSRVDDNLNKLVVATNNVVSNARGARSSGRVTLFDHLSCDIRGWLDLVSHWYRQFHWLGDDETAFLQLPEVSSSRFILESWLQSEPKPENYRLTEEEIARLLILNYWVAKADRHGLFDGRDRWWWNVSHGQRVEVNKWFLDERLREFERQVTPQLARAKDDEQRKESLQNVIDGVREFIAELAGKWKMLNQRRAELASHLSQSPPPSRIPRPKEAVAKVVNSALSVYGVELKPMPSGTSRARGQTRK